MINVMIVEDQKMIRSLLEGYIENADGYCLVASVSGASEAVEICSTKPIDLVLMDVQTERNENGLIATKTIKQKHPSIKIIVVTSLIDCDVLKKAKASGADSLWYKDSDEEAFMKIVRSTVAGERVFPDSPPAVDIGTAKSTEFTKTERIVLHYLVKGLSYRNIAEEMGIEVTTVKYHITNMLQKTNLKNKLQLALAVSENKFIINLSED